MRQYPSEKSKLKYRSFLIYMSTPTPSKQSGETRPKQPQKPLMRFMNERKSKIMSELHKEAAKRWTGMSEEAKRPFVGRRRLCWEQKKHEGYQGQNQADGGGDE